MSTAQLPPLSTRRREDDGRRSCDQLLLRRDDSGVRWKGHLFTLTVAMAAAVAVQHVVSVPSDDRMASLTVPQFGSTLLVVVPAQEGP